MLAESAVAFVTGGGSGLGRATALAFAKAGARVCISDVALRSAEETAHLASRFAAVEARALDVTREDEVVAAIDGVVTRLGRLDYAFNSAGIRGDAIAADVMPINEFQRVMDVNALGVFLCQREELRVMYGAGRGAIVNMASTSGFVTTSGAAHYTASKHAVIGLTKAAAFEAAPRGVRVNAVAPGTVETPLNVVLAGSEDAMRAKYTASYPVGRLGRPEEVAEAVLFLCEERASFICGHTLVLDGGMLLR